MSNVHPYGPNTFHILDQAIANPGTGNQFSIPAPTNGRSRCVGITFSMLCDFTAVARGVILKLVHGGDENQFCAATVAITALTQRKYYVVPGQLTDVNISGFQRGIINMPREWWLDPGDSVDSEIFQFQGGDRLTSIKVRWHLYPSS